KEWDFRPVVIKALNHAGRDWRRVCEVSNMEALCATVEADLAVVPLLASTVPKFDRGPELWPRPAAAADVSHQSASAADRRLQCHARTLTSHPRTIRRPLPPRGLRQGFGCVPDFPMLLNGVPGTNCDTDRTRAIRELDAKIFRSPDDRSVAWDGIDSNLCLEKTGH